MKWQDEISVDPAICHGQPCFKGTRVLVHVVLDNLAVDVPVDSILQEDDGVIVGESDTRTAQILCRAGDGFRRCRRGERIDLPRLTDVPILTELAGQITTSRAKGEHGCAREEVVQGFFLDRVDTETTRTTVSGEHHLLPGAGANKTQATLTIAQPTEART